jgi:preprotein translocase subunit SecA
MIRDLITKLLGDPNAKALKKIYPLVTKIIEIEQKYQTEIKDQAAVLAKTEEFKDRVQNKGESLDSLLPEAFALVKTACRLLVGTKWPVRNHETVWDMVPYDVQMIGGIVLHQGDIAEMKTGEGKTLVCTLPVYLNALTGKGVFVVTVNDYLAHRDSEWMGGLYSFLGMTVGVTVHGMDHQQKKVAYNADITYGTNNEFGFDYLRDNMATSLEAIVQRNLHYAIVDEVDSILVDEARTPLIISAPAEESTEKYRQYSRLIGQLTEKTHYEIDEKQKTATLTEEGIKRMEELLNLDNIYTDAGFEEVHHIEQALRAYACYKNDVDYMIKDNEVLIIDEFTGRLMPGRRYSHGLHQAIEAKENVEVQRESKTLATVSFQNYFRLFDKLAGMTGTAATEAEEFYQIYGLETIIIPTNKPCVRKDFPDGIYKTQKGKFMAVVRKIQELHKAGQPVLVGTVSVEKSEIVSQLLKLEGVPHSVLNAKQHEHEAEIVANAGQKGMVTIATNMAGRGTDIKLGEEVKDAGGLFILGTERHEARRIDNQLRGRGGRQGDPGASQFFVSMDDDLMRLFGGDRIKKMMDMLRVPEDMPIENNMISHSIESAQKKVEGHNFDIRKHLVEYDDVMNVHRNIIYKRRKDLLDKENIHDEIEKMITDIVEAIVKSRVEEDYDPKSWDLKPVFETIMTIYKNEEKPLQFEDIETIKDQGKLIQTFTDYLLDSYNTRMKELPEPSVMHQIEKAIFLRTNDALWMDHIDEMSHLRETVAFTGYAQKDPLVEYKSQAFEMFNELIDKVQSNTINTLFKIDLRKVAPQQVLIKSEVKNMQTNEDQVEAQLTGNQITRNTFDENNNPVIVKVSGKPDGTQNSAKDNLPKVGRNDLCPCGSGQKYKKCHGK